MPRRAAVKHDDQPCKDSHTKKSLDESLDKKTKKEAKFEMDEHIQSELDTLHNKITDLLNYDANDLLFGRKKTHIDSTDPEIIIPNVFKLDNVEEAKKHYLEFGFVVFDVFSSATQEETECKKKYASLHCYKIFEYLKLFEIDVMNSTTLKSDITKINNIRLKKKFPPKLNLGVIGGTLYQNSVNSSVIQTESESDSSEEEDPLIVSRIPASMEKIEKQRQFDDYIAQSKTAWLLRYFCHDVYKQMFGLENKKLLASVENSTCMFPSSSKYSTLQSDKLHFLPRVFSNEMFLDAKGFLSLNEGNSFSLIPYIHNSFEVLQKNMKKNGYINKRTFTRAIPPKKYNLDHSEYVKRISLKMGHYLIYDPRLLVKFNAEKTQKIPHVGLNVMFFDPIEREFTEEDHSQRLFATMGSYIVNDDKIFGHTIFTKRRGKEYLLPGTFQPEINELVCESFLKKYNSLIPVKNIIHHRDLNYE